MEPSPGSPGEGEEEDEKMTEEEKKSMANVTTLGIEKEAFKRKQKMHYKNEYVRAKMLLG